ncbi:MAG: 2,3-bisphosphoglycerate-independent phosphoglycerate mutase [Sedimentitalea sp.]
MTQTRPVVLCILDGWGLSESTEANAPYLAKTPVFDALVAQGPSAQLITHGPDVGLPAGQMGNSEVGHMNIGAGRVVAMDLGQIDLAIQDGNFFENKALLDFIATLKGTGGTAHLLGVLSDGGVHGHLAHMHAAANAIAGAGVPVALHFMADGRDVAPRSAMEYMAMFDGKWADGVHYASLSGRYFAMDRDNRWERVSQAYRAIVQGDARFFEKPCAAIDDAYRNDISDEFISPARMVGYDGMRDGDGVFCLNFRADRAREIMAAIADPDFDAFDVGTRPKLAAVMGMAEYSDAHSVYMSTVYPKAKIENTLGAWVSKQGKRQFRLAETEKYPHVTFFLNGGEETPNKGEDRTMPASPKVATYDLQPEMSSGEVTEKFVGAISEGYDLIVTNFANPDMVGHTGDLAAAIAACEAVDRGLGRVVEALTAAGGMMIVTADHGNCEMMIDPETGGPHTAHTTNPVPVVLVGGGIGATLRDGRLADLAPTLLALMNLPQPPEMTGESLLT